MSKSIQVKQPELETKRIVLLQNESDLLKKREELQEKLLLELSKSQGDILKNEVFTEIWIGMEMISKIIRKLTKILIFILLLETLGDIE